MENRKESYANIVPSVWACTRCDFFTRFATIPPDCLRLVSHETIVAVTRHDKNRV